MFGGNTQSLFSGQNLRSGETLDLLLGLVELWINVALATNIIVTFSLGLQLGGLLQPLHTISILSVFGVVSLGLIATVHWKGPFPEVTSEDRAECYGALGGVLGVTVFHVIVGWWAYTGLHSPSLPATSPSLGMIFAQLLAQGVVLVLAVGALAYTVYTLGGNRENSVSTEG